MQEFCCKSCSTAVITVTESRKCSKCVKLHEKGETHLDYLSIRGRIILKWTGIEVTFFLGGGGCRLDLGPVANCFDSGNEHLTSINGAIFFEYLIVC